MNANRMDRQVARDIATTVFEGTRWLASEEDMERLTRNVLLIEEKGLSKLNQRLIENRRGIWDTFAEHNFAIELITYHGLSSLIDYEPEAGLRRPPDFKVQIEDIIFWLQMKKLSKPARENRRDKTIQKMKKKISDIKKGMFCWCNFSSEFCDRDLDSLVDFIKKAANDVQVNKKYLFPTSLDVKATVEFWYPNKSKFEHLMLSGYGDLEALNLTGEDAGQIQESLKNAAGAFEWESVDKTINIIVMEADNKSDIDIGEAVFGQELFHFYPDGKTTWRRDSNGLFQSDEIASKVAGVMAIRRKERKPCCFYSKYFFLNERFVGLSDIIRKLIPIDRMIRFNEVLD